MTNLLSWCSGRQDLPSNNMDDPRRRFIDDNDREQQHISDQEKINEYEKEIERLKLEINTYQSKSYELEVKNDLFQKQITSLQVKLSDEGRSTSKYQIDKLKTEKLELEQKLLSIQDELNDSKNKLKESTSKCNEITKLLEQTKQQMKDNEQQYAKKYEDIKIEYEQRIQQYVTNLNALNKQLNQTQERLKATDQARNELLATFAGTDKTGGIIIQRQLNEYEENKRLLEGEINSLKLKISNLENELVSTANLYKQKSHEYEQEIGRLKDEIYKQKSKAIDLEKQNELLNGQLKNLQTSLSSEQFSSNKNITEVELLNREKAMLEQRIKTIQVELNQTDTKLSDCTRKLSETTILLEQTKAQLQQNEQQYIQKYQSIKSEADQKLIPLTENLNEATKQLKQAQEKLRVFDQERNELGLKVAASDQNSIFIQEHLREYEEKIKGLEHEKELLSSELIDNKKIIVSNNEHIIDLKQEIKKAKDQYTWLQSEHTKLQNEFQILSDGASRTLSSYDELKEDERKRKKLVTAKIEVEKLSSIDVTDPKNLNNIKLFIHTLFGALPPMTCQERKHFIVQYEDKKAMRFNQIIENILTGNILKLAQLLNQTPTELNATYCNYALNNNKDYLLCDIICSNTNIFLKQMQDDYSKFFGGGLLDEIKKKYSSKKSVITIFSALLDGSRPEDNNKDTNLIEEDITLLKSKKKWNSSHKDEFINLFISRNVSHLNELNKKFILLNNNNIDLIEFIKKTLGSQLSSYCLQVLIKNAIDRYDYYAFKLKEAFKSMRIDLDEIMRIIISRSEIDLKDIISIFDKNYSDNKTLAQWLNKSINDDIIKNALTTICDNSQNDKSEYAHRINSSSLIGEHKTLPISQPTQANVLSDDENNSDNEDSHNNNTNNTKLAQMSPQLSPQVSPSPSSSPFIRSASPPIQNLPPINVNLGSVPSTPSKADKTPIDNKAPSKKSKDDDKKDEEENNKKAVPTSPQVQGQSQEIEISTNAMSKFMKEKLNTKTAQKIWEKLDKNNSGVISSEQLLELFVLIMLLYYAFAGSKIGVKVPKDDKPLKQSFRDTFFSLNKWIISNKIKDNKITKDQFFNDMKLWVEEYVNKVERK